MNCCEAKMQFSDDFGDNCCTFHCQLEKGHEGPHQEKGKLYDQYPFNLTWGVAMEDVDVEE